MLSSNFLASLSAYCDELAPVVGPLLTTVAETSRAVLRAQGVCPREAPLTLSVQPLEDDL